MTRLSLAKEKVRILLLEGIHDNAAADLAAAGYANVERLPRCSGRRRSCCERIAGVHLWASARAPGHARACCEPPTG